MKKINVLIVGAQKAGTTSLNNYLSEHPQILGHPQTEFAYFTDEDEYQNDFDSVFKKCFTVGNLDSKLVLAKNAGLYANEKAIKRLANHNPACKIIYVLREPVSRAISSYNMEKFNGWLKRNFEELKDVIEREDQNDLLYRFFINLGLYSKHLKILLKYFPKENIKVCLFKDLTTDTINTCKDIYNWIGVSDSYLPNFQKKHNSTFQAKSKTLTRIISKLKNNKNLIKRIAKKLLPYSTFTWLGNRLLESNKSKKKPEPISKDLKLYLYNYFKPYNNELKEIVDINLDAWEHKYDTP